MSICSTLASHACRQLSYEGAEFQLKMISLQPTFQVQYARASALWQLLDMVIYKEGVFAKSRNRLSTTFWGDHQRFFKSMLVAAKVLAVAAEARDAIAGGYSVVVGLQSTGAANMEAEKDSHNSSAGLPCLLPDPLPRTLSVVTTPLGTLWCCECLPQLHTGPPDPASMRSPIRRFYRYCPICIDTGAFLCAPGVADVRLTLNTWPACCCARVQWSAAAARAFIASVFRGTVLHLVLNEALVMLDGMLVGVTAVISV